MVSQKTNLKKPVPAPKAETPKTATAPATTAPATTEKPAPKKRENTWRKTAMPAGNAVLIFNEAAYAAKPKRNKSKDRIENPAFYLRGPEGTTVDAFRKAYAEAKLPKALANADIKWDLAHGFISVKVTEPVKS